MLEDKIGRDTSRFLSEYIKVPVRHYIKVPVRHYIRVPVRH